MATLEIDDRTVHHCLRAGKIDPRHPNLVIIDRLHGALLRKLVAEQLGDAAAAADGASVTPDAEPEPRTCPCGALVEGAVPPGSVGAMGSDASIHFFDGPCLDPTDDGYADAFVRAFLGYRSVVIE